MPEEFNPSYETGVEQGRREANQAWLERCREFRRRDQVNYMGQIRALRDKLITIENIALNNDGDVEYESGFGAIFRLCREALSSEVAPATSEEA